MRGHLIQRVVFSLDGKRIGSAASSPFRVHVHAGRRRHSVRARITFKDATRAKTLTLRYRACAAAGAPARAGARRGSPDEPQRHAVPRPPGSAGGFGAGGGAARPSPASRRPGASRRLERAREPAARGADARSRRPDRARASHARRIESVAARRPLTGVRTVFPCSATRDRGRPPWVHVRLPGRPNGHTAGSAPRQTRRASTAWRIAVKLSARRVTVYHHGRVERRFRAVVGKPSTPTPRGRFFIEEALALSSQAPGGPFALATSARSNVLQEFEGGPGQIALHGTNGLSGRARHRGVARLRPAQHAAPSPGWPGASAAACR